MKKKIFIIFSLILGSFFVIFSIFADQEEEKSGYEKYEQRVENICEKYKSPKLIYKTEEYPDILEEKNKTYSGNQNHFQNAKKTYQDNMNNIYKCMVLNSQEKALKLVKEDLGANDPKINEKIDQKIKKINTSITKLQCMNISDKNESLQKLLLLKRTTYELCKYHSYLEYLRQYNSKYNNLLPDSDNPGEYNIEEMTTYDDGSFEQGSVVWFETKRKREIDNEISHIYEVYPAAYAAYNQYENNVLVHVLLELLKEDYVAFRKALHNSLNPINQVVYKIANAMRLD